MNAVEIAALFVAGPLVLVFVVASSYWAGRRRGAVEASGRIESAWERRHYGELLTLRHAVESIDVSLVSGLATDVQAEVVGLIDEVLR